MSLEEVGASRGIDYVVVVVVVAAAAAAAVVGVGVDIALDLRAGRRK